MPKAPCNLSTDTGDDGGSLVIGTRLHEVCNPAAEILGIPWPSTLHKKSQYEGNRLPQVKSTERQLLHLFPECLEEATCMSEAFYIKEPGPDGSYVGLYSHGRQRADQAAADGTVGGTPPPPQPDDLHSNICSKLSVGG